MNKNSILLAPRVTGGGSQTEAAPIESAPSPAPIAPPTTEQIATENESLKRELAAAKGKLIKAGVSEEIEALVREKMMAGLSREHASVCARRQVLHDEALKITDPIEREQAIYAAASAV